jgi:predicted N-acetyltransferase YhbS
MCDAHASEPAPVLAPERRQDAALVEGLIARAFGPGRFAKTAERLREGATPSARFSHVAWLGGEAVGCVRLWPVAVGRQSGLLLGPIAVEAHWRRRGLGASLVRAACEAAASAGAPWVILVGDEPLFGPLGFSAAAASGARLPGPVDSRRVMLLQLAPGSPPVGEVRAAAP